MNHPLYGRAWTRPRLSASLSSFRIYFIKLFRYLAMLNSSTMLLMSFF